MTIMHRFAEAPADGGISDSQQLTEAEQRIDADLLEQEREHRWNEFAHWLRQGYQQQQGYLRGYDNQQLWGEVLGVISSSMRWPNYALDDAFGQKVREFAAEDGYPALLICVAQTMEGRR